MANLLHLRGRSGTNAERLALSTSGLLVPYFWQETDSTRHLWAWNGSSWIDLGASGSTPTFLDLSDTPSSYVGQARKAPMVNYAENALEFILNATAGDVSNHTADPDAHHPWPWENVIIVAKSGGDHATIQAAYNAAIGGETVLVAPGTYTENLNLTSNKDITIRALGGFGSVVIDGSGTGDYAIDVDGAGVIWLIDLDVAPHPSWNTLNTRPTYSSTIGTTRCRLQDPGAPAAVSLSGSCMWAHEMCIVEGAVSFTIGSPVIAGRRSVFSKNITLLTNALVLTSEMDVFLENIQRGLGANPSIQLDNTMVVGTIDGAITVTHRGRATTTRVGPTRHSTDAETQAGTGTTMVVTPASLHTDIPATPAASRGVRLDASGHLTLPSGGNIVTQGAGDVRVLGEEAGLGQRRDAYLNPVVTDHFDYAALSGWTGWAGAPFVTPPTVDLSGASLLQVGNFSGASDRAFLYRSLPGSPTYVRAAVGLYTNGVGFACGVRLDDGSDDNYAESVLYLQATNPDIWRVQRVHRTGGGGVTTADGSDLVIPLPFVVSIQATGTKWTNWSFYARLESMWSVGGLMFQTGVVTGLTWTPTRIGLIFKASGATAWHRGTVDFYDQR